MKNLFIGILLFALMFVSFSCVSAQPRGSSSVKQEWNPQKTWVFFVGLLEWEDSKTFASFPQKNRRDKVLLDVLRARGVPEDKIVYLQDKAATTAKIQTSFENFLKKAQPDDWVFVYYCGHGYKSEKAGTLLASYDATDEKGWRVDSIPETIDQYFKGSNALIMLDNCYSGAMAEAVRNRRSNINYAVLASSHFNSFSTGNWTFTESLIYGFRGDALIDDDANGNITLGELTENAAADMLFAEDQIAQFAFTGKLNNQIVIAKNSKEITPRLGERVEAFDQGDWYRAIITDVQHGEYKVHFFGYEYDEDAFRNARQIRPFTPKQYKVGSIVEAESDEKWYPAKILEVKGGAHLVAYVDYGEEWNEWIPIERIRRKK